MIGRITPLVKGAGWRSWTAASGLHLLGAAIAAAISGWMFGLLGQLLGLRHVGAAAVAAVLVLVAGALHDSGVASSRMPHLSRQTPAWLDCQFGAVWSSMLWGLDLGLGWSTRSCFATYFGAAALVVWAGSPTLGAAALSAYGVGRGLPVIAACFAARRTPVQRIIVGANSLFVAARLLNAVALAWAAGFVAVVLLR